MKLSLTKLTPSPRSRGRSAGIAALGLGIAVLVSACVSGGAVPADKLGRARASVKSAQEMGAERNPTAAAHLRVARDELAAGRKLVIDGEQDKAAIMLLKAEADADLAMNLTRESTAIADVEKTRAEIEKLQVSMKGGN